MKHTNKRTGSLNRDNLFFFYIKVHTATRWTIRHGLMLLWFTNSMDATEEVTIHRPNVSTLSVGGVNMQSFQTKACVLR